MDYLNKQQHSYSRNITTIIVNINMPLVIMHLIECVYKCTGTHGETVRGSLCSANMNRPKNYLRLF